MLTGKRSKRVSRLFKVLGDPFRVRLLLALGDQEACVCHLERLLGKRQAYISQQLMSLRDAELLAARREGKYIFYSLREPKLLEVIQRAAGLVGVGQDEIHGDIPGINRRGCACPRCETERSSDQ